MYSNILVPVLLDDDHDSAAAFKAAQVLADEGAAITLLHVFEVVPGYVAAEVPQDILDRNHMQTAQKVAEAAKSLPNAKGETVIGHAGRSIVDYAKANGSDCIIIASHKPGLEDYFLGSTAARVVRHAPCAVHVIR